MTPLPPVPEPIVANRVPLMQAIRGPVMLIALGALLVVDQSGRFGFERTWPALLILFGIFKLLEYRGSEA